jgi:hypothetical protein
VRPPFPLPASGDLLWCRFPQDLVKMPGPKPRPGLVLAVGELAGQPAVTIAFGTSQKTSRLYAGEFLIDPADGPAFRAAVLSYPTKFNLFKTVDLLYTEEWFGVAPGRPFGHSPKMGVLHASLMRRAKAALSSAGRRR